MLSSMEISQITHFFQRQQIYFVTVHWYCQAVYTQTIRCSPSSGWPVLDGQAVERSHLDGVGYLQKARPVQLAIHSKRSIRLLFPNAYSITSASGQPKDLNGYLRLISRYIASSGNHMMPPLLRPGDKSRSFFVPALMISIFLVMASAFGV